MLHVVSSRLDRVFVFSENIYDDEIKSHFARYLCVLTSGYLEESIKIIISSYAISNSSPVISNYVNSTLQKISNLNTNRIELLLNSINPKWKMEFKELITDEEKDAIDSVVANRHQIAHGRNVGVSYSNVKEWYKKVKCAVGKIQQIINS